MNGHAPHLVAAGGSRARSYSAPSGSDDDDELDLEDDELAAEEDPDVRMLRNATTGGVVSHVMPQPLQSSSSSAAAAPDLAAARPQSPPPAPSSQSQSQSDLASSRISTLLLRGYSLLGETCPRQGCVGVPLMGQPTTFARRNRGASTAAAGRKECVICGTVYGPDGQPVVAPTAAPLNAGVPATLSTDSPPAPAANASVEERKAALYDLTTSTAGQDIGAKLLPGPSTSSSSPKQTKKRAIEEDNGGDHNEFGHRSNPTALATSVPSAAISRAEQALFDLLDQMTSQMRNEYLADAGAGAGSLTSANRLTSLDLKALLERMKEVMEALEVARRVRA